MTIKNLKTMYAHAPQIYTVVCKDIMITITYSVVQKRFVYTLVDKCLKQSLKVLSTHLHISDMAYKHTSWFRIPFV